MNRKMIFYAGLIGLLLFELANVYFIMPMPGSQRLNSLELAYGLHRWRWVWRGMLGVAVALGWLPALRGRKWIAIGTLIVAAGVVYQLNFEMAADKMFLQPSNLRFADAAGNKVGLDKLVLGLSIGGREKAYPIQFIGYHHQVRDTLGQQPVMVTYCTVCRTGRAYKPEVNGRPERFRLVGMDHFNALLEDATTGTWWRQVSGEAVAGPLKGQSLPELPVVQASLREWLALYPNSLVMQADSLFAKEYADMDSYDTGKGRGKLTGTDTLSWHDKSWVVGLEWNNFAKAFDWNELKRERVINDALGGQPVVLVLADDGKSFFAYERPAVDALFSLRHDTLVQANHAWTLSGQPAGATTQALRPVMAHQEFWHSWSTFHPFTTRR